MAEDSRQINEEEVEELIKDYPSEQRYILAMMQDLQKKYNYLPREGLEMVAEHVNTPVSKIYSMATFYKAFSLVPKGRYNIKVCDGTACHIKGSTVLIDQVYKYLGIKPGETTADGVFSLETVNCLGACAIAPVVMVNEQVHSKVTSSGIIEIIESYRGQINESVEQS